MGEAAAAVLLWVAGTTVGLASCAFWLALKLPMRIMDIFDAGSVRVCGWAITAGLTVGALISTVPGNLGLGGWVNTVWWMLSGAFVGMVASALTETLDVLPQCLDRMGMGRYINALAWALVSGKALGALLAILLL